METENLYLGIDIGTSKIATVLFTSPYSVVETQSELHDASVVTGDRSEQDPTKMQKLCYSLIKKIPTSLRKRISGIGVTGQMHGILLTDFNLTPVTNLINWQDKRCSESPAFLPALSSKSGHKLSDGFGLATLAWLAEHKMIPSTARHCCTVQDLVVADLTDKEITMDSSMAASWGLFDSGSGTWDLKAVAACGIDPKLLPKVVPCGSVAGTLPDDVAAVLGMTKGIPVMAAIGDNQASLLGSLLDEDEDIALTLGTGGQVSVIVDKPITQTENSKFESRPFVEGKTAVVAAAMCGGEAWMWLSKFVLGIAKEVAENPPCINKIYEYVNDTGMESKEELEVAPHFLGERFDSSLRASISGITLENASLGSLSRGVARGIVRNLKNMLPEEALKGKKKILGSGNALRRVPILQKMVEEEFGLPLIIPAFKEEAAVGAAVNALNGHTKGLKLPEDGRGTCCELKENLPEKRGEQEKLPEKPREEEKLTKKPIEQEKLPEKPSERSHIKRKADLHKTLIQI